MTDRPTTAAGRVATFEERIRVLNRLRHSRWCAWHAPVDDSFTFERDCTCPAGRLLMDLIAAERAEARQPDSEAPSPELAEAMTRLADGPRSKWHDEVLPNGAGESWVCVPIGDVLAALPPSAPPAPSKIVVLPPASWAEGAADLLERALYLRAMSSDDAAPVEQAITDHLNHSMRAPSAPPALDATTMKRAIINVICGWQDEDHCGRDADSIAAEYARLASQSGEET